MLRDASHIALGFGIKVKSIDSFEETMVRHRVSFPSRCGLGAAVFVVGQMLI